MGGNVHFYIDGWHAGNCYFSVSARQGGCSLDLSFSTSGTKHIRADFHSDRICVSRFFSSCYQRDYWGSSSGTTTVIVANPDADGDGINDASDNCVEVANSDQANTDGDAEGDACDADDDNDTLSDVAEAERGTDPLKADTDDDDVRDDVDNCGTVANGDQADLDADGLGDACDPDVDGDNVANDSDNCRTVSNADQIDADNDGKGAACDTLELPRTKDDCKDSGWRSFDGTATFRNQGDCVSYVATGGRNKPAAR